MMEDLGARMDDVGPLLFVLLAGVAASGVWRWAGVAVGTALSSGHGLFEWARAVAAAIVAGQAATLVAYPTGAIAEVAPGLRVLAVGIGFLAYHFTGRNVLLGVVAGDAAVLTALAFR